MSFSSSASSCVPQSWTQSSLGIDGPDGSARVASLDFGTAVDVPVCFGGVTAGGGWATGARCGE
jgi:hypothetical protein